MDQTFCEKIALDRQLANLLIQLRQLRLVRRGTLGRSSLPSREQRANPLDQRLLHASIWLE
jgi:hypothetical protein